MFNSSCLSLQVKQTWICKISLRRPAGNSPSLWEISGISCINLEHDHKCYKGILSFICSENSLLASAQVSGFWETGSKSQWNFQGGFVWLSCFHRCACVLQAPGHTETEQVTLRLRSEELSIHPGKLTPVLDLWGCTDEPASPRQSQELINDNSRS